ncbi:flagellar hook-associated protein FlgL [Vibrio mediterranei]|uniref:flagellar hook-associated protein FlgL n=1 Tax=Vibrio mediterranei TaxID=689 RepID=UPI00406970D8
MRVTDTQTIALAQMSMMNSNYQLNKVYEQIATGKKLNHISDDPVAFVRAQVLDKNIATNEQFSSTMSVLKLEYGKYETHLSSLDDLTMRINDLILQGKNGSLDPESREGFAIELEAARDEIINLLNTKDGGRYLYSGTDINTPAVSDTPPYAITGNGQYREVEIASNVKFTSNVTADDILAGADILNTIDAVVSEFRNPTANFDQVTSDAINTVLDFQSNVLGQLSTIGGRINAIDRMIAANEDVAVYSESIRSELVETDYAQAAIDLNKHMITLEASQKTFMQLMNSSLFDLV